MAFDPPDADVTPFDVIFSCALCQKTISEIYDRDDVDAGMDADPQVTRLWLTDCGHITCSEHLEGGGRNGPELENLLEADDSSGAPFHPDGERPKATCPYCKSHSSDETERTLYFIRSSTDGQHDPDLPKEFFDTPPVRLGQGSPGMVALRFQYMSLVRFGTSMALTSRRASQELQHAQAQAANADRKEQDLNNEIQRLRVRVGELDSSETQLRLWQSREKQICHYLGVFTDLTKENAKLREQLLALGYSVPTKIYTYNPAAESQSIEAQESSESIRQRAQHDRGTLSARPSIVKSPETTLLAARGGYTGSGTDQFTSRPAAMLQANSQAANNDKPLLKRQRTSGGFHVRPTSPARRFSRHVQDRQMMPPPPLPDDYKRHSQVDLGNYEVGYDFTDHRSHGPSDALNTTYGQNGILHGLSTGRRWRSPAQMQGPEVTHPSLTAESQYQKIGRAMLADGLTSRFGIEADGSTQHQPTAPFQTPQKPLYTQSHQFADPYFRDDIAPRYLSNNGSMGARDEHDARIKSAMSLGRCKQLYRNTQSRTDSNQELLQTCNCRPLEYTAPPPSSTRRGPITPSPYKRRLLAHQSVASPFFKSTGAKQHTGSVRLSKRYATSSDTSARNQSVFAPLQSPGHRQAPARAPGRCASLNSLSFVTEPHSSGSHQLLPFQCEMRPRDPDPTYANHTQGSGLAPVTPRNAEGLFERRNGYHGMSYGRMSAPHGSDLEYVGPSAQQRFPTQGYQSPGMGEVVSRPSYLDVRQMAVPRASQNRRLELGDLLGMKTGATARQGQNGEYIVSVDGRRSVRR